MVECSSVLRGFVTVLALAIASACGTPSGQQRIELASCLDTSRGEGGSDMVRIPAGFVIMGSDNFGPEEQPRRRAEVSEFWIDRHEVTNRQFREFVDATGFVTLAEKAPVIPANEDVSPDLRKPGGIVFRMPRSDETGTAGAWWRWTPGASWRHPEGPGSSIVGRDDFPVLQISYSDAAAYAKWRGGMLPTEAQWERAARGDHQGRDYIWGDEAYPGGKQMANSWQGPFPAVDEGTDGFLGVAPVGCFPANDFGLLDMAGNVWEWTKDNFSTRSEVIGEVDGQPVTIRGGSWLCAPNYCGRFRPSARQFGDPTTGTNHIGFRIVRLSPPPRSTEGSPGA